MKSCSLKEDLIKDSNRFLGWGCRSNWNDKLHLRGLLNIFDSFDILILVFYGFILIYKD